MSKIYFEYCQYFENQIVISEIENKSFLTLYFIMLKKGQTYFKNLAV